MTQYLNKDGKPLLGVYIEELVAENVMLRKKAAHPTGVCTCPEEEKEILAQEWKKLEEAAIQLEHIYSKHVEESNNNK